MHQAPGTSCNFIIRPAAGLLKLLLRYNRTLPINEFLFILPSVSATGLNDFKDTKHTLIG